MSATGNTPKITVAFGSIMFVVNIEHAMFPLTWTRVCVSMNRVAWSLRLVVNGVVIKEMLDNDLESEKKYGTDGMPTALDMVLGYRTYDGIEFTGMVSQVNVFSSSLSTVRMISLTNGGGEECGAPGDYVNWEIENWLLTSRASIQMVEISGWVMVGGKKTWIREGPCRRDSELTVFTGGNKWPHSSCMKHCEKLGAGRSPPIRTQEEWDWFTKEVHAITADITVIPSLWLAATDAKVEGEWKDAYPPHDQLNTSWAWPWRFTTTDTIEGNDKNCFLWWTMWMDERSWAEEHCTATQDVACLKDVS